MIDVPTCVKKEKMKNVGIRFNGTRVNGKSKFAFTSSTNLHYSTSL